MWLGGKLRNDVFVAVVIVAVVCACVSSFSLMI